MSGHLFLLRQKQFAGTIAETKKMPVSAKQWEAGADEIKEGELIFLASGKAGGSLGLWLTAKASTGALKSTQGGFIRLSFVKSRVEEATYTLVDGLSAGESLSEVNWKRLDDEETRACFFDTKIYSEAVSDPKRSLSFRSKLSRSLPKGLGLDSESICQSVLFNGSEGNRPILRDRYDAEILFNEPRYRDVLKQRLINLDGRAFEDLLREFFKHSAFKFDDVRTTSKSHDAGIDLLLTRHDDVFGSLLIVGQCKRHIHTISPKDVQALATVRVQARAGKAVFITTAKFSEQARKVAEHDGHIELIDGDKLVALFFQNAEKVPGLWGLIRHTVQLTLRKGKI